ncbi:hypothetical protein GT037_011012 [Alternaria burnsii]|uniref:Uncharacterized protein n=1 Tax=Alternaria burnsii TaxID=1187904 RepID=A0A8H7ASU9_9PLEO|nr:uncharacterized protein GT037_011012 [Alternaria burnsii]KAF7670884.1 hypothetical protein GT037_011012 [Alternaria burnsii]
MPAQTCQKQSSEVRGPNHARHKTVSQSLPVRSWYYKSNKLYVIITVEDTAILHRQRSMVTLRVPRII